MLDLLIRGGSVVDGTGVPARRADLGVRGGRIVSIGPSDETEIHRTIDADGLVVAPGFIDLHTHYDAQLLWDPTASPSPLHGVTTVIGGNCGFALAPVTPEHTQYLMRMMARVEGIPLSALEAGVRWDWQTVGEYLDALGPIAVNAGFLVGHSAIRMAVMGDRGLADEATPDDLAAMSRMLDEALDAGGLGFSSSQSATHKDADGHPVPSRAASVEELVALSRCVADHPGATTVGLIVPGCIGEFSDDEVDLMAAMSRAADRPLNWNVLEGSDLLGISSLATGRVDHQLAASSRAAEQGGRVIALTLPHTMRIRFSFETGFGFDTLPGWQTLFAGPLEERIRRLSDPDERRRLGEGAASPDAGVIGRSLARWALLEIAETFAPETKFAERRTVGDVATELGKTPFDALCDIIVADGFRTGLRPPANNSREEWTARGDIWRDDRTVIGGADAGAHLDMMCGAAYTTTVLGSGVRDYEVLTLEEAVHELTDVPARLYGLRDRGRIAEGWCADLVVFDPARVGPGRERTADDLPGGASRLFTESEGIEQVLVAGREIVRSGGFTGDLPGQVLRSGSDTEPVTV